VYDDVLLPTDGSPGTASALEHALGVASERLHLLSVVDRRVYLAADDDEGDAVLADLRADAEDALAEARERTGSADVDVESHVREGVPYREILAAAEELGVGPVVMGSHGHRGREKREALGSTTERVVREGACPVLVVDIGD
jgi:nucleotide-binding universal stress UspA family protein